MKLQTLLLGLALAVSGAAFAHEGGGGDRDVTVIRNPQDHTVTRIVRREHRRDFDRDFDRDRAVRHVVILHPHHRHHRVVRKVVLVHPAHPGRTVVHRTVIVHRG